MSTPAYLSINRTQNYDEFTGRVIQSASIRSRLPKSRVQSRFLVVNTNRFKAYWHMFEISTLQLIYNLVMIEGIYQAMLSVPGLSSLNCLD